jgi:deoxyribose-phosphate aldolase
MMMNLTYEYIAKRIDHSLLGPTLTDGDLEIGCRMAAAYNIASVCIKPAAVSLAARVLMGTDVRVGTTVGFPHGGTATKVKVFEARNAIDEGASELDIVINIGWALGGQWHQVRDDIAAVVKAAHEQNALVKVIFENCYLSPADIVRLCKICGEVNADFVKTSTGYGSGGATHEDLKLMRDAAPAQVKLKAAGGVRTLDQAIAVARLGCDRIGASRTSEILDELKARLAGVPHAGAAKPAGESGGY